MVKKSSIMKKYLFTILFFTTLFPICVQAQLEKVIVETYYISDTLDATDTDGGGLEAGSTTYRVYVDLAPGFKLFQVYGDTNHLLKFASTQNFFNNIDFGQTFGKDFTKTQLKRNTVALDTWLTIGQTTKYAAAKTYFGVLKTNDDDSSFIAGAANNNGGSAAIPGGLLTNANPLAGIPLTVADGNVGDTLVPSWIDNGIVSMNGDDSTIFGSIVPGNHFESSTAYIQNNGTMGVIPDSNHILVAQFTTKGQLSFELNIKILTANNQDTISYVASDSLGLLPGEILNSYLKYPYAQICGCPNPLYLEYSATRDCDAQDSCKHLIIFGCMDSLACNYDAGANFNLQELCCYPGYCNDRDLSVVCPSILSGNRELIIYPNPAHQQLNLKISGVEDATAKYIIYNSFGRIVSEKNYGVINGTNTLQVDIANLETGLYLIQLNTNDASISKAFMKN